MSIVAVHGPTMASQAGQGPTGDADPGIGRISPGAVLVSAGPTLFTITGNDFEASSVIEVNGRPAPTTFVNATTLTTTFDPEVAGQVWITVRNASGAESNSYPFLVTVVGDGDPDISAITPASLPASAGSTLITVTGTDFEAGAVIEVGAVAHTTTFVNSTSLTTNYDPSVAGVVNVTVRNLSGKESNDFPFEITAAAGDDPEPDPQNPDPLPGPDPEPEPEPEPESDVDVGYDPAAHSVDEVKAFADGHTDEVKELLDAEVAGKNRTTLVSYLESLLPYDPADYSVDDVKEYVNAYPEYAADILALERDGKNRSTLVSFLEELEAAE